MEEKNVLGVLAIVTSAINPLIGLGFLGLCGWTHYSEYKRNKVANNIIKAFIKEDNAGLRRLVGDEEMDRAIRLVE